MSIVFSWDPVQKTGYFKLIHASGATHTTFLESRDLEVSSFRILLDVLDEEVRRSVTPEAFQLAFNNHSLNRDSHPQPRGAGASRNRSVNPLSMGRRRRRPSAQK